MKLLFFCLFLFAFSLQVTKEVQPEQGYLCQACVLGVNLIRGYIHQPDEVLIQMLVESCEKLPEYFVDPCKLTMRTFGKELIAVVREYINEDSRQICLRFGACAAKKQPFFKGLMKNTPLCQPCQIGASFAKDYFGKLKDQQIKDFLYKGCLYAPDDLQPMCRVVLGFASDGIISGLRDFLRNEPKQMCQTIGLCD